MIATIKQGISAKMPRNEALVQHMNVKRNKEIPMNS